MVRTYWFGIGQAKGTLGAAIVATALLAAVGCGNQAGAPPATTPPTAAAASHVAQAVHPPTTLPAQHLPAAMTAPPRVPGAVNRTEAAVVVAEMDVIEQQGTLSDGVEYTYWTFGGTVPGPFLRVRAGDVVELKLKNKAGNLFPHSIDLHAVTGPGGGAKVTQILPGEDATFRFTALNPGIYVYHCATPVVPTHIANGMYGLILVEPQEGLPKVDREYYVMQGDFYTMGATGEHGHQIFSMEKMMREQPEYVVFNGATNALMGDNALKAKVGETVRVFFGVGGPNLTSSFHVIGEIFDKVYTEGASEYVSNVQTHMVPAGGATMVEFTVDYPGAYILVDHSLSRLLKGAAGTLVVEGEGNPMVFDTIKAGSMGGGGH